MNTADDSDGMVAADVESNRYAGMCIGEEEFVVFDRENHRAWIQSSDAVVLRDRR